MAPTYQPMVPPSSTPFKQPTTQVTGLKRLFLALKANFSLFTLLLAGALFQSFIILVFSGRHYALTLTLPGLILTAKLVNTLLEANGLKAHNYKQGVIPVRASALVPDPEDSEIKGLTASSQKVAVLLLGAKSNHPLGLFASGFRQTGEWLTKMNAELDNGQHAGYLGSTNWSRVDERGSFEANYISYWRSIEDIHNFAHSPLHREAWAWWDKHVKELDCVGINHEIFEAPPGHWENVYINFQPTGMGATSYMRHVDGGKTQAGTVGEEYVRPLVNAARGPMAKSSGRLGRAQTKHDLDHERQTRTNGYYDEKVDVELV